MLIFIAVLIALALISIGWWTRADQRGAALLVRLAALWSSAILVASFLALPAIHVKWGEPSAFDARVNEALGWLKSFAVSTEIANCLTGLSVCQQFPNLLSFAKVLRGPTAFTSFELAQLPITSDALRFGLWATLGLGGVRLLSALIALATRVVGDALRGLALLIAMISLPVIFILLWHLPTVDTLGERGLERSFVALLAGAEIDIGYWLLLLGLVGIIVSGVGAWSLSTADSSAGEWRQGDDITAANEW